MKLSLAVHTKVKRICPGSGSGAKPSTFPSGSSQRTYLVTATLVVNIGWVIGHAFLGGLEDLNSRSFCQKVGCIPVEFLKSYPIGP